MSAGRNVAAKRRVEEELVEQDADSVTLEAVSTEPLSAAREAEISELILNHRENGRKLARSILRRWRVRMPAEEIDSIVDLSLCEAARRYSSERGASFMTFFFYHLRGHLVRSVARAAQGNNVFLAFARNAGVDTDEWPNLPTEVLWSYMPDYLLFGQRDIETPEHVLMRREKISQCRSACDQLDNLEREIIDRSFSNEQPLVDIARSLGYSRCHISRVKKSALDRLKLMLDGVETDKREEKVEKEESVDQKRLRRLADNIQTSRVTSLERAASRRTRRRNAARIRLKRVGESKAA